MIKPMVRDYEYIIIDCPPSADEQASQSALLISDVCLMPLQPTPADMWATVGVVKLVEKAQTLNEGLKAFGVANRVTASSLGKQVLSVMAENNVTLLEAKLGNRTSFQEATINGSTPQRMGASHKVAAAEVETLVTELLTKMGWAQ
jgi:chromosome partitioning protein